LLPADHSAVSAPLLALQAVHDGRAAGWSDDQIVARTPVALALTAPSLSVPIAFGADVPTPRSRADASLDDLAPRDALRLRIRWLQELQCRIVSALADRLVTNGAVPDRRLVFELSRDELDVVAAGHPMPDGLEHRPLHPAGAPLPPSFRIGERGELRATTHGRSARSNGLAAGGGRAVGVARHRVVPGQARSGVILVTRHLEPQLAPLLPSLDGLVAETGSALSHLAILAREMGVPTVVGVEGALQRFPSGTHLLVDGATGVVEIVDSAEMSPAPVLDAVPS